MKSKDKAILQYRKTLRLYFTALGPKVRDTHKHHIVKMVRVLRRHGVTKSDIFKMYREEEARCKHLRIVE